MVSFGLVAALPHRTNRNIEGHSATTRTAHTGLLVPRLDAAVAALIADFRCERELWAWSKSNIADEVGVADPAS
jgi:hypothetical protein